MRQVVHHREHLHQRRLAAARVAVEDVARVLRVLEDLVRLPPDDADRVRAIQELLVLHIVLEILVGLDLPAYLVLHDLVEERQAAVNDLVAQVVDYGVPEAADCAPIAAHREYPDGLRDVGTVADVLAHRLEGADDERFDLGRLEGRDLRGLSGGGHELDRIAHARPRRQRCTDCR